MATPATGGTVPAPISDLRRSTNRRLAVLFTLSLSANIAATVTMHQRGPAWLAGATVFAAASTLVLAIAVEVAQWVRERTATEATASAG